MIRGVLYFLVTLLALVRASDVIVLTESNFDLIVNDKDFIVVEFYAPWCGHCKKLEPEWNKAAATLKRNNPPIPLAKVDATENGALASKFGVSGYPTIKIFRRGTPAEYGGPRDSAGIIKFLKSQVGPSATEVNTATELEKFLTPDVAFVSFGEGSHTTNFFKLADKLRNSFNFAHTKDVSLNGGVAGLVLMHSPIKASKKHDTLIIPYEGAETLDAMEKFIEKNALPLVGIMDTDNLGRFKKRNLPILTVYTDVDYIKNPKGSNYYRNRIIKACKEFSDEITLSLADKTEFAKKVGDLFNKGCNPACAAVDADGQNYVMNEPYTPENLKAFAQSYLDGNVEQHIKSEAEPADNNGPVKIITGKNFNELVLDESKDVLLEFYAPWCGHCKSLAPKYDELGLKMKDHSDIMIAKIDATANEYPKQFAVSGYPTIYWVPHNNKSKPEKYEGAREVADFVKYIKKKSKKLAHDEL